MKLKMFPNWCKKLGFLLFVFGFFASSNIEEFRKGFNEGYYSYSTNPDNKLNNQSIISQNSEDKKSNHLYDIISILGMIVYLFSKEKIEDDYINKLRLESYQLTAIFGLVITIIFYAFSKDIKLTLDYFIILFSWTYLITFAVKKRIY